MKITNTKIMLGFILSPLYLGGGIFTLIIFLTRSDLMDKNIREIIMLTITSLSLSIFGVIIFSIPSMIVGLFYLKTMHLKFAVQEILCGLIGMVSCTLWLTPIGINNRISIILIISGTLTSVIVARIFNYIKNKESIKNNRG